MVNNSSNLIYSQTITERSKISEWALHTHLIMVQDSIFKTKIQGFSFTLTTEIFITWGYLFLNNLGGQLQIYRIFTPLASSKVWIGIFRWAICMDSVMLNMTISIRNQTARRRSLSNLLLELEGWIFLREIKKCITCNLKGRANHLERKAALMKEYTRDTCENIKDYLKMYIVRLEIFFTTSLH